MFKLSIYTPNGIFIEKEVNEVIVPSLKGPLSISSGYTNIIEVCEDAGVIKIIDEKGASFAAIFNSIVKVIEGHCIITASDINSGIEVDLDRAIRAKDKALNSLQENLSAEDIKMAKVKLAKAISRISAKNLTNGKDA
ncbi:MAG: ATP synthase delta/epsilon chain alpha-helix domain-containing protein [Bacilli bacterium]|nr:ATP synthase delta/epsilon chain alpha-helix domain-containing protein [Bacilli bacterium]MDY6430870.1 ATP synthase delta/epsilon chain alpha-helix domain-containing protein [Bacilli bacterium]